MINLKLVGIGMVLCCGVALGQLSADAAILDGTVVQGARLGSYLPEKTITQEDAFQVLLGNRDISNMEPIVAVEGKALDPLADNINSEGYATDFTTSIRINKPVGNFRGYKMYRDRYSGPEMVGSLVGNYVYFGNVSLNPNSKYVIYGVPSEPGSIIRVVAFEVKRANRLPVITAPDRTFYIGDVFDALEGVTAKDEEDGDLTNIEVKSHNVNPYKPGEYEINFEVTDSAGGVGTATSKITVVARNTVPVITAPDRTIEVGSKFDALEGVTAYDKEDGVLTNTQVVYTSVKPDEAGEYIVRYEVRDSAGAIGKATAKITVVEKVINTVPVITAPDRTIEVGSEFDALEGVTAKDEEDGALTNIKVESDVDTTKIGKYEVRYEVTDSAGAVGRATATITVIAKNTVPVITAPDRTIEVGSEFDALEGVTAKDEEDGALTNIKVESDVDTTKIGKYEVRYEVTDSAGAVGRATATITVIAKNTVPVITAPDRTIEVGSEFDALKGVTAKDEEDGVLTNIQVKSNGVNTEKIGEYEVRYEVTDSAGAVGTATATITVIAKNTIPVITAPDRTIEVGSKFNALEGVTAKDKEDGALTNIAVKSNNVDTAKIGEYEVRYEVVDSAGAVGTATAKISVVEIELAMPVVNEVLDTDNVVKGTAEKNTTLYLKMGLDYYEESVGEDGTFSSNLDTTYTAGTAIEAYVKDNDGRTSKTYKGSVQLTKIKNPYLEILTDTSKILIGRGRANTTLFVKIGEDSYEEDIPKTGLFKLRLDQTYPVGTPIEAYILDPVTNQESDITYAAVVPAEVISLNRVTSEDKKITGITIPNAHIKVSVYPKIIEDVTETDSRKRTYYGNSDDSGNFDIAFSIAYPADSKIEVEVTNPTTGRKFKKAIQIYPRKPTIAAVITGDRKVTGTGDQNAQIILTVNNQVYSPVLADEAGNYSINLTEALPSGAVVSVYQVVSGIKSEVAETTARP